MIEVETDIDRESKLSKAVKKHEPNIWAAYQDMVLLVGGNVAITSKLHDAWTLFFKLGDVLNSPENTTCSRCGE